MRVILTEQTDWLGGQITNQGVSALDEHRYIEEFGGTSLYCRLRDGIRARYQQRFDVGSTMLDGKPLNPGNGWVSALCFEPRAGLQVLNAMLDPHVQSGTLSILLEHLPTATRMDQGRIVDVTVRSLLSHRDIHLKADYYLDATDLGDLLPLAAIDYVTGAEAQADTGELHARSDGPRPSETQGFTYCFAVEYCVGEDHTIDPPMDYKRFRDEQPYTLVLSGHHGERRPFGMFTTGPTGLPPFWTYRRLLDGTLLDPSGQMRDVAMINWSGNDYHAESVIDRTPSEQWRIHTQAKELALGFLYWLQTEVPRDDGEGRGYPGLRLLPAVMGTDDGLSKAPYIRESRRIVARRRIVEGDISAEVQPGARAKLFTDSVGVGWYAMDLHDCVGNPTSMYAPTRPFQIPLGALVPREATNLIAACKNIGTTHLTNGAYRLHPIEWNIGESAGALAAFCCQVGCRPSRLCEDEQALRRFQYVLISRGIPLAWTVDVSQDDPLFIPTQLLCTWGGIAAHSERWTRLEIDLDAPLCDADALSLLRAGCVLMGNESMLRSLTQLDTVPGAPAPRAEVCQVLTDIIGREPFELSDPPTWADVSRALAPLVEETLSKAVP
jgi:hypothetical protein